MERSEILSVLALVISIIAVVLSAVSWHMATPVEEHALSGKLTISGSTTVLPSVQECARLFMEMHPDVRITVAGGGSGHGIKSVGAGDVDIGDASREIMPEEWNMYPDLKPFEIAKDGIAVVVHPSNPIENISLDQVSRVFAGDITEWDELGFANDGPINVISRELGSGTRDCFEKIVMAPYGREITGKASIQPSNGQVRATVSKNPSSIGYISIGYVDPSVKALKIEGVEPTIENVKSGRYKIVRSLYMITKGEPSELEKAFIDFVRSEEGQKVVESLGYISIL